MHVCVKNTEICKSIWRDLTRRRRRWSERYLGAQRLLCVFVCVCVYKGGGFQGQRGQEFLNSAKTRAMNENEWTESSPLFCDSERHERRARYLLPASRERSGTPPLHLSFFFFQSPLCHSRLNSITNWFSLPQGILNHCFDDIENFMAKLQQTAEAATVLSQRKKKKKKSKKQSAEGKKRWMGFLFTRIPLQVETTPPSPHNTDGWPILFIFCVFLFLNNRGFTHCKGPPSARGGVRRYLPEIQILLQPAGV